MDPKTRKGEFSLSRKAEQLVMPSPDHRSPGLFGIQGSSIKKPEQFTRSVCLRTDFETIPDSPEDGSTLRSLD